MSQIQTLIEVMYKQLEMKKALTYRIKSLYNNVKKSYPEYVLEDVDVAVKEKFSRQSDAHV